VPRRSAQNALWHIAQSLARLYAPILSFTGEEVWKYLARDPDDSVFLHTWHALPDVSDADALLSRWAMLRGVKADVQKHLEELRVSNRIGSSLQGEVEIRAHGERFHLLRSLGDDLRLVLLTSAATVREVPSPSEEGVTATPSSHAKCERCWHYRADVGADAVHPTLCGRCVSNLFAQGEARTYA
jgi:isoleucyl-tRNA synthetase